MAKYLVGKPATGWTDVDLTDRALTREAGRLLKEGGYAFDVVHVGPQRAIRRCGSRSTSWICCGFRDKD
jgi:hypothetical protein